MSHWTGLRGARFTIRNFPPLPVDYSDQYLTLRVHFLYNPAKASDFILQYKEASSPHRSGSLRTIESVSIGKVAFDRRRYRKEKAATKGKGRDIGYALVASSCEGAHGVEYAPSRPSMRSLLSQFQTPTTPRRAVGFFGSGRSLGRPNELITQLTLDWPTFLLTNPFSRRRGLS
jgi:hypothetical protein